MEEFESIDELQKNFIAELRALQSELFRWWMDLTGIERMNEPPPPEVAARWPTGISGHPRFLEIFQRHFFELEYLNDVAVDEARRRHAERERRTSDEEAWGSEDEPLPLGFRRPVDVLINEVEAKAPDLAKLVTGLIMVPIGETPEGESF